MILHYLVEKEMKQMMRNIILPIVFVLLPLFMMNMVPRIATQEIKNLNFCVVDNDHSSLSRRMTEKISASSYFHLVNNARSYGEGEQDIKTGDADFIIEIPRGFEKGIVTGDASASRVMLSANATNGTKAGLGQSYLAQIINDFTDDLREESGAKVLSGAAGVSIAPRFLFNLELDYKIYMIPALIAMILTLLLCFLPALNIVGEKEKGTIEQINVTPISRMDFILSKLIPYWIVGLFILFYSMFCARLFHGIWPAGSLLSILLLTTLYIVVASSLGLIISNLNDTIQQAALIMFFFLVIFLLLSGLLTPVTSMPAWAKAITEINPLRYFIEPMRIIYIKGSSITELLPYYTRLFIMGIVTAFIAIRTYKKSN